MLKLTPALIICLIATLLPIPRLVWGGVPNNLESKLAEQQRRIKQVQKSMEEKRSLLRASQTKESNLLGQLDTLNQSLNNGHTRLAKLKQEAAEKAEAARRMNAELTAISSAKEQARSHVEKRLAAFYRMGDVGLMNVLFSTHSLPELLNLREYFRTMLDSDRRALDNYHRHLTDLARINQQLQRENAALTAMITATRTQEEQLTSVRQGRLKLLATVSSEKELYQQALVEMEEAATNLTQTLSQLREKLATQVAPAQSQTGKSGKPPSAPPDSFAAQKGRLHPPVRGAVATYFGKHNKGKFGLTTSAEGIDIKTLPGAEISAIYTGKVVYVGQLRGYGNLLIIDHGQQYYSLISRASTFYKKVGDQVATGDVIGVMHDQGGLLGEGLHLEIRRGTEPENPLDWLNRALLKITP